MSSDNKKLSSNKRFLASAITLLSIIGLVGIGTYARRRIAAESQARLQEVCREKRLQADLPSIIFHDSSGSEIAVTKGTGYKFSAEAGRLITRDFLGDDCEQVHVLYDLSGNTIIQFPVKASVRGFDAEGKRIFTSFPFDFPKPKSIVYSIDGWQRATFLGTFRGTYESSDNISRRAFTTRLDLPADQQIQMYDFSGEQISALKGSDVSTFSTLNPPANLPIITNSSGRDHSYIYDLWGNSVAQVEGTLASVIKNTEKEAQLLAFRVSTSPFVKDDEIHLYTLLGEKIASLPGTFASKIEIEGRQYILVTEQPSNTSTLYNFSGNKVNADKVSESSRLSPPQIAKLEGEFFEFTEDDQILTYTAEQTLLHDAIGRQIATFDGTSPQMIGPARRSRLVTYSNKEKKSFLYRLNSTTKLATLDGQLSITSEDNRILTTDASKDISYLYDEDGTLRSKHVGSIPEDDYRLLKPGFSTDSRYLLTTTQQGALHIWPLR